MSVSFLVMLVSFLIPILFGSFVHRHFYNKIRIGFGLIVYFVPYMILIQWFPQGDDLLKLYFLLLVSYFLGILHGKIIMPWVSKDKKRLRFNAVAIVIVAYLLFDWPLLNLEIAKFEKNGGLIPFVFIFGSLMIPNIIEDVSKT